jgi:hypothetical protein
MAPRLLGSTLLAAMLLGLTGCGDGSSESRGLKRAQEPASDRVGQSARRSEGASILQRRGSPPEGVEELVSFFASGDTVCGRPVARPRVVFDRRAFPPPDEGLEGGFPPLSRYDEPEVGERFAICPAGFEAGVPLRVAVTDPTGRVQVKLLEAQPGSGQFLWDWAPRPGDPLGEYRVKASQGELRAERTFRLHPASEPNIAVLQTYPAPQPGDEIDVMLVGFEPRERVRLNVYGSTDADEFGYRGSVSVRVGPDGNAIQALSTGSDDSPGCAVVRVDSPAGPLDDLFCIGLE